jgi:hypothetical protein
MDADEVRRLILELPEVEEYEHGGLPAFRVRGKRLASLLNHDSINLMLGEEGIRAAIAEWPQWCSEEWFGQRLTAAKVRYRSIDPEVLRELVTDAWSSKAPKSLVRTLTPRRSIASSRTDDAPT